MRYLFRTAGQTVRGIVSNAAGKKGFEKQEIYSCHQKLVQPVSDRTPLALHRRAGFGRAASPKGTGEHSHGFNRG